VASVLGRDIVLCLDRRWEGSSSPSFRTVEAKLTELLMQLLRSPARCLPACTKRLVDSFQGASFFPLSTGYCTDLFASIALDGVDVHTRSLDMSFRAVYFDLPPSSFSLPFSRNAMGTYSHGTNSIEKWPTECVTVPSKPHLLTLTLSDV
jgi:hypothetical protein